MLDLVGSPPPVCACVFRRATCVELSHSLYALHPGNSLITKCVRSLDVCSLMCRDV